MIIYIFNSYLYDNFGFAKRCKKMIDAISQTDEVIILCRSLRERRLNIYTSPYRKVRVVEFAHNDALAEIPKNYNAFFYETSRNIKLMLTIGKELRTILRQYKNQKDSKIFAVASPLTVPFITLLLGYLYKVRLEMLEMHDLEPELARHIKKLSEKSLVYRIELWLEKFLCRHFKKVIVTTQTQKETLVSRTCISAKNILVIPNTVTIPNVKVHDRKKIMSKYGLPENSFVLTYSSALTYDYAIDGVLEIIEQMPTWSVEMPKLKLLIVGDGESKKKLVELTGKLQLSNIVFTGKVDRSDEISAITDAAIIPWKEDFMTKTMLPTKFFEYMSMKKAIIAPNFGEFRRELKHKKNGMLYINTTDLFHNIKALYNNPELIKSLGGSSFQYYTKNHNRGDYSNKIISFIHHE